MRIDLRYGEGYLPTELGDATIVRPDGVTESPSPQQAVNKWFEKHTIDSSNAKTLSLVVDESSELDPIQDMFTEVMMQIQSSPNLDSINVIASRGNAVWGLDVLDDSRIMRIQHDSTDESSHEFVGETPTHSTPVHAVCEYLQSDVKIGLGTTRLDPLCGSSGGPFSVLKNIGHERTILRNERLGATKLGPLYAAESALRTDALEATSLAGLDLVFNGVPGTDENLDFFAAGDPATTTRATLESLRARATVPLSHCADIAIASQGGYPFDSTLHSSIGGLVSGYLATLHGGVIILVAECSEGAGPSGFVDVVSECQSEEEVVVAAETQYEHGMDVARLFWRILSSRKVILCSRLRQSLVTERLYCTAVRDPEEGIESAEGMVTSKSRIVILPDGNKTLPMVPN